MKNLIQYINIKSLSKYINESEIECRKGDSLFKEKVKYSTNDWEKWLDYFYNGKSADKHIMIGSDPDSGVILIYIKNGNNLKHVGTYNPKTTVLYTDDIHLFGNEIKESEEDGKMVIMKIL